MSRVKKITREQYLELTSIGVPCRFFGWLQREDEVHPLAIIHWPDSIEWAQKAVSSKTMSNTYLTVVDDEENND